MMFRISVHIVTDVMLVHMSTDRCQNDGDMMRTRAYQCMPSSGHRFTGVGIYNMAAGVEAMQEVTPLAGACR